MQIYSETRTWHDNNIQRMLFLCSIICLQYLQNIYNILRQIIPALNSPSDIDNYEYKSDDGKLLKPLCKLANTEFKGIGTTLIFIKSEEMKTKLSPPTAAIKIMIQFSIVSQNIQY